MGSCDREVVIVDGEEEEEEHEVWAWVGKSGLQEGGEQDMMG